jgi:hypothetical protein
VLWKAAGTANRAGRYFSSCYFGTGTSTNTRGFGLVPLSYLVLVRAWVKVPISVAPMLRTARIDLINAPVQNQSRVRNYF